MTDNEKALLDMIHNSTNPEKIANYMLNLILDYLRTHAPSQEKPSVARLEFA